MSSFVLPRHGMQTLLRNVTRPITRREVMAVFAETRQPHPALQRCQCVHSSAERIRLCRISANKLSPPVLWRRRKKGKTKQTHYDIAVRMHTSGKIRVIMMCVCGTRASVGPRRGTRVAPPPADPGTLSFRSPGKKSWPGVARSRLRIVRTAPDPIVFQRARDPINWPPLFTRGNCRTAASRRLRQTASAGPPVASGFCARAPR